MERELQFKETTVKVQDKLLTYKDLLLTCLDRMPQNGWVTSIMRERIELESKFKSAEEKLMVSDKDLRVIKECVRNYPWAIKHMDLVEFEDYILAL